ncbi:MAG: DUF320 domain-containing protein [Propionibacteriales bacterium]|nr:DUF320 domain-containing protein [Propionibacteriales bacterium]
MNAWIRRALCAVGITGGIVLLGLGLAEAASADGDGPVTTGESGILSGNQTGADVKAPINLSGNQITVIGQHNHASSAGASTTGASTTGTGGGSSPGSPTTSGEHGIGSGNQTAIGVQAPINASGNQVTVIGQDNEVKSASGTSTPGGGGTASSSPTTSGEHGIASGNQTGVDVKAPINASGNQVTVIGQHNTVNSLSASSTPAGAGGGTNTTSGAGGLVSGNQTALGIALPINISGNQVTAIGQDNTNTSAGGSTTGGGQTGGTTGGTSGGGQTTTGEGGVGSGNQTPISVQVPIDTSGNQVTVVGQGNTNTSTSGSSSGGGTPGGGTQPPSGGGVVSPPGGGNGGNGGASGAPSPVGTVLPNTGAPADSVALTLLALALLLAGGVLLRREATLG